MKKSIFTLTIVALFSTLSCQKDAVETPKPPEEIIGSGKHNPPPTEECPPVSRALVDQGGTQIPGALNVTNNATNILLQVSSILPGYYITNIKFIYGSLAHVTDFLTQPSIFYDACTGPSRVDFNQSFTVANAVTTMTTPIPVSNFGADGCIYIAALVTFRNAQGMQLCAAADPYDILLGSVAYQSAFKYCRQNCPDPPPPPPTPGDCCKDNDDDHEDDGEHDCDKHKKRKDKHDRDNGDRDKHKNGKDKNERDDDDYKKKGKYDSRDDDRYGRGGDDDRKDNDKKKDDWKKEKKNQKIRIVHKAGYKKWVIICVDKHSLKAHLKHGDYIKPCPPDGNGGPR